MKTDLEEKVAALRVKVQRGIDAPEHGEATELDESELGVYLSKLGRRKQTRRSQE